MEVFPYKSDNGFIQIDLHKGLFYPVPPSPLPVPLPGWHIGSGRLSWGPSWGHQDNDGKVLADGHRLLSQGHEVTNVIVAHSNIPPVPPGINIMIPLLILGSSNESVFSCGSVRGPKGPIAVAAGRVVGANLACNDPCNLPTSIVYTGGTVLLGFTWEDFLKGLVNMAISSVTSAAFDLIIGKVFKHVVPRSVKSQLGMFYHRMLKKVPGLDGVGRGVYNQKGVPGILGRLTNMSSGKPGFQSISRDVSENLFKAGASAVKSISELSEHIPSL